MGADADLLFEVRTLLGFSVHVSRARRELIAAMKHPVMSGREAVVRLTLEGPDEIRQSRSDGDVLLFYKAEGTRRSVCAVARQARDHAFLVTAYPTGQSRKVCEYGRSERALRSRRADSYRLV